MSKIGQLLGKAPGIPSYRARGERRISKTLQAWAADCSADIIGIIRTDDGWHFEPLDLHHIKGQQWAEPVDSDEPWYPCDGLPSDPPRLFDVPVAIGYKDFGALTEVPNVQFRDNTPSHLVDLVRPSEEEHADDETAVDRSETDQIIDDANQHLTPPTSLTTGSLLSDGAEPVDEESGDADGKADGETDGETDEEPTRRARLATRLADWRDRVRAGLADRRDRFRTWWRQRRLSKGLSMLSAGATAAIIKQDGDAVMTATQADYNVNSEGPEWYVSDMDRKFDARGAGATPHSCQGADIGVAFAPIPKLISPVLPRAARNIHSLRVVDDPEMFAEPEPEADAETDEQEQAERQNGHKQPLADGGTLRHNDIRVEERALVWPADLKLLGGEHETQEHLDTLEEQIRAKENPPGGELFKTAGRLGGIILAFIIGAVLGDPSGLFELAGNVGALGWLI